MASRSSEELEALVRGFYADWERKVVPIFRSHPEGPPPMTAAEIIAANNMAASGEVPEYAHRGEELFRLQEEGSKHVTALFWIWFRALPG